jgi:hypothetical protein
MHFFLTHTVLSILTSDGNRLIASTIDTFDYANSFFSSSLEDSAPGTN